MAKGKLGEQLKVSQKAELRAGKLEQQQGLKPSVAYTRRKREYDEKVARERRRIELLNKEVDAFQAKQLDYNNYETEYNKLSSEAKKYFTSPKEIKQTSGYKKYKSYKSKLAAYNKEKNDYDMAMKAIRKGKGAGWLTKRQREIYRQIKESQGFYEIKAKHPGKFDYPLDIYQDNPDLMQRVIEGKVEPEFKDSKLIGFEVKEPPAKEFKDKEIIKPDSNIKTITALPSTFYSPEDIAKRTKDQSVSLFDATKGFFSSSISNIKTFFTPSGNRNKQKEYLNPFRAFSEGKVRTGTFIADEPAFPTPQFGTIIEGEKQKTKLDIEQEKYDLREIEKFATKLKYEKEVKNYASGIQKQIDTNKISLEDAQKKIDKKILEVNKEYKEEAYDTFKKYPLSDSIYKYRGSTFVPTAVGLGIDIGAFSLGAVNPSIPVGYFSSKGIFSASRGDQWKATENLAFAGLSAGAGIKTIGKQITKLRVAELERVPWEFNVKDIFKKGDRTLVKVGASKSTGLASAETDVLIPIRQFSKGKFNIEVGKGATNLRVVDYNLQGTIKNIYKKTDTFPFYKYEITRGSERQIQKEFLEFTTAAKGVSKPTLYSTPFYSFTKEGAMASYGTGYYNILGKGAKTFRFGSLAERGKGGWNILGGDIKKLRIYGSGFKKGFLKLNQKGTSFDKSYYGNRFNKGEFFKKTIKKKKKRKGFYNLILSEESEESAIGAIAATKGLASSTLKDLTKTSVKNINKNIVSTQLKTGTSFAIPSLKRKTKTSPTIKTNFSSKVKLNSKVIPTSVSKSKSKFKQPTLSKARQYSLVKQSGKIIQSPLSREKLKSKSSFKTTFAPSSFTPSIPTNLKSSFGLRKGGMLILPSKKPIRKTIKRKPKKKKRTSIYRRPSLVALGLDIKAPEIKGKETAFSIRPIITKKRKKKK